MYENFFGFKERPFQLVPNPAYLFLSRSHEEVLAHLTYAVSQGDGFVEITGEVGTGKTTLCRVFLDSLEENAEAAYIFNPMLDAIQLLQTINEEFGIDAGSESAKDLIDRLNRFLMERKRQGRQVLLLIDEAQNLNRDVLEQLRLLSNLETNTSKLLQIILVGQPELRDLLDSHDLRQLRQRITLSCHLRPLTLSETRDYIRHRLQIAAQRPALKFSRNAFRAVFRYSRGVPRLINIICDRALLTAYGLHQRRITGRITAAAIQEISSSARSGASRGWRRWVVWGAAAAGIILAAAVHFNGQLGLPETLRHVVSGSPAPEGAPRQDALRRDAVPSRPSEPVGEALPKDRFEPAALTEMPAASNTTTPPLQDNTTPAPAMPSPEMETADMDAPPPAAPAGTPAAPPTKTPVTAAVQAPLQAEAAPAAPLDTPAPAEVSTPPASASAPAETPVTAAAPTEAAPAAPLDTPAPAEVSTPPASASAPAETPVTAAVPTTPLDTPAPAEASTPSASASDPAETPVTAAAPVQALADALETMDRPGSRRRAFEASLGRWQSNAASINPAVDRIDDPKLFFQLAAAGEGYDVYAARQDSSLALIRRLNLPVILEFQPSTDAGAAFLTLVRIQENGQLTLLDGRQRITGSWDGLRPHWTGRSYVLWRNLRGLVGIIPLNAPQASIITLKMMLQDIGYADIDLSPRFDPRTRNAVEDLQARHGLPVDGYVGPLTMIALYNDMDLPEIPRLQESGPESRKAALP